jgi:predicted PurR-regulated permease PerM
MSQPKTPPWVQHYGALLMGCLLAGLVYLILTPFFSSILWAAVLAYVSWPAYRRIRDMTGERSNLSAALGVFFLSVAIVVPALWLTILVKDDLVLLYKEGAAWLRDPEPVMPGSLAGLPVVGEPLEHWIKSHMSDPADLRQYLGRLLTIAASWSLERLGDIGKNAVKIVVTIIILFFFYRDGETVQMQVEKALRHVIGNRSDVYLNIAGRMSRAIVQSALLAALLQGFIAGIAYWIAGAEAPALLSIATAFASLLPFVGTTLVWGVVAAAFLVAGDIWKALGIVVWGLLAVHPIDNILRPALISTTSRVPMFLVMVGVLGGIAAFGLIGIFLGPVILTIANGVWKEWVNSLPIQTGHMDY